MRLSLRYTHRARLDLLDIRSYLLDEAGAGVAKDQLQRMRDRIDKLREFPLIGPARDDLGPNRRVLTAAPYLVIYTAHVDEILILRVLHGARDLPDALTEA